MTFHTSECEAIKHVAISKNYILSMGHQSLTNDFNRNDILGGQNLRKAIYRKG